MSLFFDIVIVGAGHGGAQTAIALRRGGFAGSIAIVGAEPELPYERPPLSKDYLAGDKPFERMLIRPLAFWEERNVAMRLGRRVTAVAAEAQAVTLDDGATIGYGQLVWAAGGRPRPLGCAGAGRAHLIRSRGDVDRIAAVLPNVRRVVVVGGGYIGLEAAAVLIGLGKQVVLLEALDRLLARVAGPPVSAFFEAEHKRHGVDVRTGVSMASVGDDGIQLAGGERIAAELAIAGIGIEPVVEPLIAAGAEGGDGVAVDGQCRTSLPGIFAIGDCAWHPSAFAGGNRVRIESVQNATDQATIAAAAILGEDTIYDAMPWLWSNQYDLRLQTVGLSGGYDDIVVRGDPAARSFSAIYLRGGRVIALDCVNQTRDYVQGRKLIAAAAAPEPARLRDPAVPLKELA